MCIEFVNRDREFEFLERQFDTDERQLLVLYGRRRVGKTELVTEFLERQTREFVYFLADQRGTAANAARFAQECADAFDDMPPAVDGFDDVFTYITRRVDDELIVVIDEFSYLVAEDDVIPSVFQRIHDEILAGTDVSVILLGSSISMMEEGALSHDSPLYGRRTGQWKLSPLEFGDIHQFFPAYSMTDLVSVYAVLGGIPAYLEQFDSDRPLLENVRDQILSKGSFLYEEPEFFLRQELREPATYMSILEAMAAGKTTVTDIANEIGRDASGISRYLSNLQRLEAVDRRTPVTEPDAKRGIYVNADNFFSFWFRFVSPNRTDLERGNQQAVVEMIEAQLDEYTSRIFEDVCRQAVHQPAFPVPVSRTGTWWYGENEIDVAAVGEDNAEERLLLGECKWTSSPVGFGLLENLERKASDVRWRGSDRREEFVLFSKSGFTDDLRAMATDRSDLHLYDLASLAALFGIES
ncbi:ATP-binding protein [Halomontanus rarus]|uniref:ATP-binding protein n=1 Tax=Halomontanus rarus TaxID=3034020 RepID=UPI001A990E33